MVLKKERLKVFEVVNENTVRAVVRGVQGVPQGKPNIEKVLGIVNVTVSATGTAIPNKVIIQGTVTTQTLYVAAMPDQPVHHMHHTLTFLQYVDVPGAAPGMNVFIRSRVDYSNVIMRSPDTVEIEVIIEFFVKVTQLVELDVVTDVQFKSIPARVKKELVKVEEVLGENVAQVNLRDTLTIPPEKPPALKILNIVGWEVAFTEVRVIPDRVVVQGTLTTQIIYVAETPTGDQPVHHAHLTTSFFTYVEIPGARPGMMVEVTPSVEFAQARLITGTTVLQEVILKLSARVTEMVQMRVVTDVRSDKIPIKLATHLVKMSEVVNEATKQINLRRQVTVPAVKPPVGKLLGIFDTKVEITSAEILDGKVVIQGRVTVQTVYVAALPDQPVHEVQSVIEFTDFIDVPGALPGMEVQVRPQVEFSNVQMVPMPELPYGGTTQLLIDVVLEVFVKVTKMVQINVVTNVTTPPDWRDWEPA
ncbi:MAG TPA: DUF3794 domain-containing protein [Firmicutes bacterium]|nr:DUF3794 domain-containing protein [Bacillota bacterium]